MRPLSFTWLRDLRLHKENAMSSYVLQTHPGYRIRHAFALASMMEDAVEARVDVRSIWALRGTLK